MYRTISDFLNDWKVESTNTLRVFNAVGPEALEQRAFENGRTIRDMAWHITTTLNGLPAQADLAVDAPTYTEPAPADFATITAAYQKGAHSLAEQVEKEWNDAKLLDTVTMYGMEWTHGGALSALIRHEVHHRGQLMTLIRLAGLRVPGVYGPTYEDMAAFAAPEPAEA